MGKKQIATKKPYSKGKGKLPAVDPDFEESDESDEGNVGREAPLMADAGAGGHKKQQKKRTRSEMAAQSRKKWLESFKTKGGNNERRVDRVSLGERYGVPEIQREGLLQWFDSLGKYNLKCVREFYMTLGVVINVRTNLPGRITAKVGDKQIEVTPDDIAKYLNYTRPDPAVVNYPGGVQIDPARIAEVIFRDPENGLYPMTLKRFKDEILILNKAMHANLYPKGKETRPTKKSLETMTAFMSPDIIVDWALFILCQMIDYSESAMNTANLVFPCMVTHLCHKQGVRGTAYTKMEKLHPGTIDMVTLHQSKAQAKHDKGKKTKEESTSGPSRAELFENPPKGTRAVAWTKHLVKCVRALFKKTEKVERSQERIEHKADWLIKEREASSSSRYEPLPQPELESTDEEESDNDEESEDD